MKWEKFHIIYGEWIREAAEKYNLDPAILGGLIMQESAGNPRAKSYCGAFGLTQVMPATAAGYGYKLDTPKNQIYAGADYLARCFKHKAVNGNLQFALAAYNAGWGNVSKYGGIPPFKETRKYIPRVLKYAKQYRKYIISLGKKAMLEAEKILDGKKKKSKWRHRTWWVNKLRRRDR